jgi:tetratricopeptide (TPR) repeat protein
VAFWRLDRRAEALRALRRAVRLAPDESDPLRNLGLALLELGRPDRAVEVLRRAAALSPGQAPALLDLAEAAFEAGRHAEAASALDQAAGLDGTAIGSRPRSLAVRDALRLDRLREDVDGAPRERPDLEGAALRALLGAGEALGGILRRRGRVTTLVFFGAALALAVAGARLLPPFVDHYLLRDAVTVVARAPVDDDANVRDRLAHAINEWGMQSVVEAERCEIRTRPSWRRITCEYAVPRDLLPGWTRTLSFRLDVEQPYVVRPEGPR